MTSAIAPSIFCLIVRYCACRSTIGIVMGRSQRGRGQEDGDQKSEVRSKPTEKACWITRVNSGNGNILGNNCAGSNDHLIADGHRKDRGVCSNAHAIAKFSRSPEPRVFGGSAGTEQVVNKHRAVGNEAFVSDGYELTDECVRLNPASLADIHALLYLYKWPDEAAVSNRAPIEINRLHDDDVFTKLNIYNPCATDLWL